MKHISTLYRCSLGHLQLYILWEPFSYHTNFCSDGCSVGKLLKAKALFLTKSVLKVTNIFISSCVLRLKKNHNVVIILPNNSNIYHSVPTFDKTSCNEEVSFHSLLTIESYIFHSNKILFSTFVLIFYF